MKSVIVNVCDFHSHVLPGADHGSNSVAVTLEQFKLAKKSGVDRVVATPHFYPHRDDLHRFLVRRDGSYERLMSKLDGSVGVQLRVGAEVLICNNLENLPGLEKLCIGKSKCLLIELPFNDFFEEHIDTVKALCDNGFEVILAHADRYDPLIIELFLKTDVKLQLNASSLCSIFKKKHLYRWIKEGRVVALGSDIHGIDKRAYYKFARATHKLSGYIEEIKKASDELW